MGKISVSEVCENKKRDGNGLEQTHYFNLFKAYFLTYSLDHPLMQAIILKHSLWFLVTIQYIKPMTNLC